MGNKCFTKKDKKMCLPSKSFCKVPCRHLCYSSLTIINALLRMLGHSGVLLHVEENNCKALFSKDAIIDVQRTEVTLKDGFYNNSHNLL